MINTGRLSSKNTIWDVLQCWWAAVDHPWVSGSPTHHWHTVTKQSELAHYWRPPRRPLQFRCAVIHLLVTLFPHNKLESQTTRNSMQKIGIAHTVNFNQSPLLCVSPASLVFGIPLRSGWPRRRSTEDFGSSWLQGEVWSGRVWGRHSGRRVMGSYCSLPEIIVSGLFRTYHILTCDKYNNKLELFHAHCWPLTGSDETQDQFKSRMHVSYTLATMTMSEYSTSASTQPYL